MIKFIKKISPIILFLAICFLQSYFGDQILGSDFLSNSILFLSIIFGFYITSLTIFVTSKYVSDLYKITDSENHSLTLLHILIRRYKYGLNLTLASLLYLLSIEFFYNPNSQFTLGDKLIWPLLAIIIFNFLYSFRTLNDLVKIILQEAKREKQE